MMIICYFFFSPADTFFLRSINLSMSLDILSSVIRAYPCVVRILECPIILAMLSIGISAEIRKRSETVPTLMIGQVFLFSYGYSQLVNLKPQGITVGKRKHGLLVIGRVVQRQYPLSYGV